MHWLYYILLLAILCIGWFVNVFGAPGLWLMLAAVAAYAWVTHTAYIGVYWLIALVLIALLAELLEFLSAGAAVKKAGGSFRGMMGAVIGGLLGGFLLTFPLPIIGTILGVCAGTFIGAMVVEMMVGKEVGHSTQIGVSAAKGRFIGTMIKLGFGFLILILAAWRCLPIGAAPTSATVVPTSPTTVPTTLPATAPSR